MKSQLLRAACAMLSSCVLGLAVFGSSAMDAIGRLGISADSARDYVWNSLSGGRFAYPSIPGLKQVPIGERATLVAQIGSYARAYAESEDFARRYSQFRAQQRPVPPSPPQTGEQMRQEHIERMTESIRQTEEAIQAMPENERASMAEMLADMKRQVAELSDPDNPMFKEFEETQNQGYQVEMETHRQALIDWEARYPESPSHFIRLRLEDLLSQSNGIDYRAELKPGPERKMIFVNPAYESKPYNWKLCYRMGEETVEAARVFARSWLQELQQSD